MYEMASGLYHVEWSALAGFIYTVIKSVIYQKKQGLSWFKLVDRFEFLGIVNIIIHKMAQHKALMYIIVYIIKYSANER
jgi:hypothetical protein